MPTQCFAGVSNKSTSSVIAMVKQGTELETDLYSHLQGIVANMKALREEITSSMAALFTAEGGRLL